MNKQEIFDTIARHLAKQGHRAAVRTELGDRCRYRLRNGDRCAIGCLIPDEEYIDALEGGGVAAIFNYLTGKAIDISNYSSARAVVITAEKLPVTAERLITAGVDLLKELQQLHDEPNPVGYKFAMELGAIAIRHGLDDRIVDELTWPKEWQ